MTAWRKVSTLRDLAERLTDGRLNPDALSGLPDGELMAELTAIPGIGPWTVQGALIIALQREDVVLPGDLALRKAVQTAYQGGAVCLGRLCPWLPRPLIKRISSGLTGKRSPGQRSGGPQAWDGVVQ